MPKKKLTVFKRGRKRISTLSKRDRDVLDGYERPGLDPNLDYKDDKLDELEHFNKEDPEDKASPLSKDVDDVIGSLKEKLEKMGVFSGATGVSSNPAGRLSQAHGAMPREEFDLLTGAIRDSIKELKGKTAKLKNMVDTRQQASPTVVKFDPKKYPVLKKGMIRLFKSRNNEITFSQYKAALRARRELSELKAEEAFGEGMNFFRRTD